MKLEKRKSLQILLGVLTGILLWPLPILLSGHLSIVEDIDLYNSGPLALICPFVIAVAIVLIAVFAGARRLKDYYITSTVLVALPTALYLLLLILSAIPFLSDFFINHPLPQIIIALPCIPVISALMALFQYFPSSVQGFTFVLLWVLYFAPIIIAAIASPFIYKQRLKGKKAADNIDIV